MEDLPPAWVVSWGGGPEAIGNILPVGSAAGSDRRRSSGLRPSAACKICPLTKRRHRSQICAVQRKSAVLARRLPSRVQGAKIGR